VDTWTGRVETKSIVMGVDCGTVINPDLVIGQLEGGAFKGASYALLEDNQWDDEGQLSSRGYLLDYKALGITETPLTENIHTTFASTYEPTGPFGAKGVGEAAKNPVAGAYANAIFNAIGIRFYDLPIKPENILAALKSADADRKEVLHESND
jgi:xanthine dehydrogenase molybdenum-binding subunit